ncbi:MAG: cytochrome P450 [Gammaproteobacteria bacterium]|nr:cytochrome P450 [Gammaproteobacteria bacterium]
MSHAAPAGLPVLDVDPYDEALLRAPWDYYEALRAAGPVVWIPRYGVCVSGAIGVVEPVFRDWRRFCSSRGVGLADFAREPPWRPPSLVLEVDPPAHTRTREVLARALSPKAVQALAPRFAAAATRHVERALAAGEIEAVRSLAAAYPLEAFGDAVGIEPDGREHLLTYGRMVFDALGPDNALRRASLADAAKVVPWIAARCAREALSPDGFGAAIHAQAAAGAVSSEEAALLVRSLLSAGIDTTVATLANLLYCFAVHPGEWQKLRAAPELAPAALDEVLRHTAPIHTFCRTATEAVTFEGCTVPVDCKLLCVMGAANRDPARWASPLVFDITRPARPHVAFGSGIHVCVGQHVARQEILAFVQVLLTRAARLEVTGEPAWQANHAVHSLASLPLRLVPA